MKLLIFGAGVIGSLYASLFSEAGYDVSLLARGNRLKTLNNEGLRYYSHDAIKRADVRVIDHLDYNDFYDYIFVCVRSNQIHNALNQLKDNISPTIVTMTNSIENYELWEDIAGEGRILPAFPGAGGGYKQGILNAKLTPYILQPTTFGEIDGCKSERLMNLKKIFKKSKIPHQIESNMHNWQLCHLAFIVPLCVAYNKSEKPNQMYNEPLLMKEASYNMKKYFRYFKDRHMLTPRKFNLILYCPTPIVAFIMKKVLSSSLGDTFVFQHASNALDECNQLIIDFTNYLESH